MKAAWLAGLLLLATAVPVQALWPDAPSYDDRYWYYVTGYTCPPYCGTTSTGTQATIGRTMACPRWMRDTWDIEGIGRRVCEDSYAEGLSDRFDVLVGSVAEAYAITGCHRIDIVQINYVIPPEPLVDRYHVQDHHCDGRTPAWGPASDHITE